MATAGNGSRVHSMTTSQFMATSDVTQQDSTIIDQQTTPAQASVLSDDSQLTSMSVESSHTLTTNHFEGFERWRPHPPAASSPASDAHVVRQGWLRKKEDLVRRWKQVYFVLWSDSTFLGYECEPGTPPPKPICSFSIKHCRIATCKDSTKPETYKFRIQAAHWTNFVSRKFSTHSELDRTLWVEALNRVEEEVSYNVGRPHEASRDAKLEDFQDFRLLGSGSFGKVELCRERATRNLFALKTVSRGSLPQGADVSVLSERHILMANKHPFLMELHFCFQNGNDACFVMDYAIGGDLSMLIKHRKLLDHKAACFYAAQVTAGIGYLHGHRIIYRDLKPENILIFSDGYLKLADFGLAKEVPNLEGRAHAQCGTEKYIAPEILTGRGYGRAVDWWSLGAVVHEMLMGLPPNSGGATSLSLEATPDLYPPHVPHEARSFMSALLQKYPPDRLGSSRDDYIEVERHHFFATMDWCSLLEKKIAPPFVPEVTSDDDTRYFGPPRAT